MKTQDYVVSDEQIAYYRQNGFIQLNDVVTGEALETLRAAVEQAVDDESIPVRSGRETRAPNSADPLSNVKSSYEQIFIQKVNLWLRNPKVKDFTLSKRFGNIAARLSGYRMRVWHDQALFKEPRTGSKTPWHQDTHYWPHREKGHQTSIWIALRDTTIYNGCMSFLPGTQKYSTIPAINLRNPQNLFEMAPQLKGIKPVSCQLKAGSCTFHNGLTFHYAGPNKTDEMREAMAILYMPDGTTYSGKGHGVTDGAGIKVGDKLTGDLFPIVSDVPLGEIPVEEPTLAAH